MSSDNGNGAAAKILVVDDEPSIVDAVSTALRYEGFDVREEGTGRGTLAPTPNSVSTGGPNTYRLAWTSGDMINGGDVTITVSAGFRL